MAGLTVSVWILSFLKVCLFIWGYCLTRQFSLIWRRHQYRWKTMLGTHGYWAVRVLKLSTPTVTGTFVYYGHLRGPLALTPITERLAAELSLLFFTTSVCCGWDSNTQPSACGANALTHCANATVLFEELLISFMKINDNFLKYTFFSYRNVWNTCLYKNHLQKLKKNILPVLTLSQTYLSISHSKNAWKCILSTLYSLKF